MNLCSSIRLDYDAYTICSVMHLFKDVFYFVFNRLNPSSFLMPSLFMRFEYLKKLFMYTPITPPPPSLYFSNECRVGCFRRPNAKQPALLLLRWAAPLLTLIIPCLSPWKRKKPFTSHTGNNTHIDCVGVGLK